MHIYLDDQILAGVKNLSALGERGAVKVSVDVRVFEEIAGLDPTFKFFAADKKIFPSLFFAKPLWPRRVLTRIAKVGQHFTHLFYQRAFTAAGGGTDDDEVTFHSCLEWGLQPVS